MPASLLTITVAATMQVGMPAPSETPNYPALQNAFSQNGFEGQYEQRYPFDTQQNWVHGYFQEIPAYGGHSYYRPYNYKDVLSQSQTAAGWGASPQMPYSQQFWHRYQDRATMLKLSGQPAAGQADMAAYPAATQSEAIVPAGGQMQGYPAQGYPAQGYQMHGDPGQYSYPQGQPSLYYPTTAQHPAAGMTTQAMPQQQVPQQQMMPTGPYMVPQPGWSAGTTAAYQAGAPGFQPQQAVYQSQPAMYQPQPGYQSQPVYQAQPGLPAAHPFAGGMTAHPSQYPVSQPPVSGPALTLPQ
jgi:hypothetical protein